MPGSGDQADLQPTLNTGPGFASLTIFETDCWLQEIDFKNMMLERKFDM